MPMLQELCAGEGITLQDLDAVAVCTGPGNFTGIRISVSAARGMALGLGKPAVGVSAFEAQVHDMPRPVTACIPAPRGTAYQQDFSDDAIGEPRQVEMPDNGLPMPDAATLIANTARIAAMRLGQDNPAPAPLYVRAADAAPPRDAPPVILP